MRKTLFLMCITCTALFAKAQTNAFDSIYQQHRAEIDARLSIEKEDKVRELAARYNIRAVYIDTLTALVEQRERVKITFDYIYPTDHLTRFIEKQRVENAFKNAIDRIVLLSGNDVSSPNLYTVFLYKDALKLTAEQQNVLVALALEHKRLLEANPRRDLWKQELAALETTLDDYQFEWFFIYKNSAKMRRETNAAWGRLQEAGLTADLDSATACNQIYQHKMKIQKASDIYTYDDAKKREAWAAIDYNAPLPVKRIYSINRKNSAKKQGYRGSFNW